MYINGAEVFGASYPTQIWRDVAAEALATTPYSVFPAPDYSTLPQVEYINSPALERDDLIAHGWPPAAPATTTTAPPKSRHQNGNAAQGPSANAGGGNAGKTANTGILPKTPPGPPPSAPPQAALLPSGPAQAGAAHRALPGPAKHG
jgi:hypothetical protein